MEHQASARDSVSIICHELRNHLSPVVTWAHVLARRDLGLIQRCEAAAALQRAVVVLHRLIDDLNAWEADTVLSILRVRLDFREIVEDAVTAAVIAAQAKGVRVVGTFPEVPVRVVGDPVRLAEVVTNLLRNAVQHTASRGTVSVTLTATLDHFVALSVTDTGVGITPAFLPHVFEKFARNSDAEPEGRGIGLFLVKHFVELHQGRVEVESGGRERGSRFLVTLPIAADVA